MFIYKHGSRALNLWRVGLESAVNLPSIYQTYLNGVIAPARFYIYIFHFNLQKPDKAYNMNTQDWMVSYCIISFFSPPPPFAEYKGQNLAVIFLNFNRILSSS